MALRVNNTDTANKSPIIHTVYGHGMPRRVDHAEQRRVITAAVARIVARDGVAAVTMRDVASEAGIKLGRLQHYVASKDELLDAAATDEANAAHDRVHERVAALGPAANEHDRMRATLVELLPLDQQRRTGALLHQAALVAREPTPTGPRHDIIRARLDAARARGELRPGTDVDHETLHLASTIAGLREDLLTGLATPAQATATLDYVLARTFQRPPITAASDRVPRVDGTIALPDTALRILRAAEPELADKGIDRASLRDILKVAGQSNAGAVQYYFGDRRGLIRAVIARHSQHQLTHRNALLDAYEQAGRPDRRALADALIAPAAAKLDDPDGGRHYLRVVAEYFINLPREEFLAHPMPDTGLVRWHRLLDELDDGDPDDLVRRFAPRISAIRFTLVQLSLLASMGPQPDDARAISYLTDVVTAILGTPFSPQTSALQAP
jgi:AcrR family transcriptional regulator